MRSGSGPGEASAAARAAEAAAARLGATSTEGSYRLVVPTPAAAPNPLEEFSRMPTYGLRGSSSQLAAIAERADFLRLEREASRPDVWFAESADGLSGTVIVPGALDSAGPGLELPVQQEDIEAIFVAVASERSSARRLYILDASEERAALYARGANAAGFLVAETAGADATNPITAVGDGIVFDGEDVDVVNRLRRWREDGCDAPAIAVMTDEAASRLRELYELGLSAHMLTPIDALTLADAFSSCFDPESLTVYDAQRSLQIANERQDLADEMVTMLVQGLGDDLDRIHEGLVTRDPESLRANIHRLLGAVQYCAVPRLTHALQTLRRSAHDLDWDAAGLHLLALRGQAALLRFRFGA